MGHKRRLDLKQSKRQVHPFVPAIVPSLRNDSGEPLRSKRARYERAPEPDTNNSELADIYTTQSFAEPVPEVPFYALNAKIIAKLRDKRERERRRAAEEADAQRRKAEEDERARTQLREQQERERQQKLRAEEEKKAPPVAAAAVHVAAVAGAEDGKASENSFGVAMARKYLEFRRHVKQLKTSGQLRQDECMAIKRMVLPPFSKLAKTNAPQICSDVMQTYRQIAADGNPAHSQYFLIKLTRILYVYINSNSTSVAKENIGHEMITICGQIFNQLCNVIPGLLEFLLGFLWAKCPLLIPDVHPGGITDQEYRIQRGYREPQPNGEEKKFNDSIKSRGKRLNGMTIFYCCLVKANGAKCAGMAWLSVCKLMNAPPVNHSAMVVDTCLTELGDLFMRHYNEQYKNLLQYLAKVYVPRLEANPAALSHESDLIGQRIESLHHMVLEQLQRYFGVRG